MMNISGTGASEQTFVLRQQFVAPGPQNNFVLYSLLHTTTNANGQVTAVVDDGRIECQ